MEKKRIGILGAGHLGRIHIQQSLEVDGLETVGFHDPDPERAKLVSEEFNIPAFSSIEELLAATDLVDIVTPTLSHYDCAMLALKANKHIFIEKPITTTVEEGVELLEMVRTSKLKAQVGHVERFNPAFRSVVDHIKDPLFIETHRLAEFNPRGTDVSVVLDLMIHDIDITLSVVNSPLKTVSASGVAVVSDTPDIANARLEFENGTVANLTASRISLKNMRKSRFFQRDAYITVDMLNKKSEIVRMEDVQGEPDPFAVTIDLGGDKGHRSIQFDKPTVEPTNAIREELKSFYLSVVNDSKEIVSVADGLNALNTAQTILDQVKARISAS
jgi:predicted dehydrogenase